MINYNVCFITVILWTYIYGPISYSSTQLLAASVLMELLSCLIVNYHLHVSVFSCTSKSRLVLPFCYRLTRVVPDTVQGAIKR